MSRNSIQIFHVFLIAELPLHMTDDILVFLFEHIGIDAIIRIAPFVVLLILGNLVDEKQAQYLDALMKQLAFPLNMGKDRLPNLNTAQLVFAYLADHISGKELHAV